jgi:aromatic amino acid aminotransferase I
VLTTDVIICEDEPYFCLFTGPWTPKNHKSEKSTLAQRAIDAETKEGKEGQEAFIKALPPTYLRFDTEGRVIRMDVSFPYEPADNRRSPRLPVRDLV